MKDTVELTEAQIDMIAERAAERALEKVYAQVGKSVLTKMMYLVGAALGAIVIVLAASGKLPKFLGG